MGIHANEKFKDAGIHLTRQQWIVLMKLNESDGLMQNDLAVITERDKTSLTRLLTTMEKKDLVKRKPSKADKRINQIFLTPNGKKVLNSTIPLFIKMQNKIYHNISDKDMETTIQVLRKIQENLSKD